MMITSAAIYPLNIPFRQPFSHSLHSRAFSDSIIVKLITENGVAGYGECIARPYVTGETVESSIRYLRDVLIPSVMRKSYEAVTPDQPLNTLAHFADSLSSNASSGVIAWNGSKAAVELALLDCALREQGVSLNTLLPAKSRVVRYSMVLSSGSVKNIRKMAVILRLFNIKHVKIKVGTPDDDERVAIVRKILGPSASIRLDANGAFNLQTALDFLSSIAKFNIDSIEQPLPRGCLSDLAKLKSESPVPVMADESIVTEEDARTLIELDACHYFNLRVSKCGGIYNTLKLADMAARAGIGVQLGCLVGETAVLSAAGRCLAMHRGDWKFIEGSFGNLLLKEDISGKNVRFGWGGKAKALKGKGLGVDIRENLVRKYATQGMTL